jgi:hypothetical protein
VGVRHALFPRVLTFGAQLHPSSFTGCQLPDAAPVCMDDCKPLRPRSGAGPGVATDGVSGEASQPGIRVPAGALPPDPARTPLRRAASGPLPQGRHRAVRLRSLALRHGSCLLSLKLRSRSQADGLVFETSRGSGVLAAPRSRRPSGAVLRIAQPAMVRSLFSFRLRHRTMWRLMVRPRPPDCGSPHWLPVATFGLRHGPTGFAPRPSTIGPMGVTRLRGWFSTIRTASLIASRNRPARRLASWSLSREGTTLPEEAGDMCLRKRSSRSD